MTSEQSIILLVSWPTTASFAIADLNADWSLAWSSTNDCHSHAVRESRASCRHFRIRVSLLRAPTPCECEGGTYVVVRLEVSLV